MKRIYLDNNAGTPVDPRLIKNFQEFINLLGNPSSTHFYGQQIRAHLAKARSSIASFLQVKPQEIIFTSGGTEGLNMVLRGAFGLNPTGHLITSTVEHASVYSTAKQLEAHGCEISFLSPGLWGAVQPEAVRAAIRPNTRLIALMAANNETGVKTDIEDIATIAEEAKIPFLVDGVALLGKESFTIPAGVSAMCFSGHKLHAPQGTGFAFLRPTLKLQPLLTGGEQEFGRRGGTENVWGILSLAKAIEFLQLELSEASTRMLNLRNQFEAYLLQELDNVSINGLGPRVVNTSNLTFLGVDGESLLINLDREGVAASHGSACASGGLEPSRVLLNMGLSLEAARSSIRFSFSHFTTPWEVEEASYLIVKNVKRLLKPKS